MTISIVCIPWVFLATVVTTPCYFSVMAMQCKVNPGVTLPGKINEKREL